MRKRTLVAVATALVTFGLAFDATASPKSRADRPAPAPTSLEGPVVDWDASVPSLTIDDPEVLGGSRAVRRTLRALEEVPLGIGPRTRFVAEDEDGVRERIDAEVFFAELDESEETLEIAVVASVGRRVARRPGAAPPVTAKRIVLYLPLSAGEGDDPDGEEPDDSGGWGDTGDPLPDDEGAPPGPPTG
jgi:hypothetical protein